MMAGGVLGVRLESSRVTALRLLGITDFGGISGGLGASRCIQKNAKSAQIEDQKCRSDAKISTSV
jgi:hypothetical protein